MSFAAAVSRLLEHEGGFVDHPNDPGGATNWGISLRWLQGTHPWATLETIRDMTRSEAVELYRAHWWDRYEYGRLPETIAAKVFDLSVNMGPTPAHKLLQRALWAAGHRVGIDGKLGPETREACWVTSSPAVLAALRAGAWGRYELLMAKNPDLEAFRTGWERRAYA